MKMMMGVTVMIKQFQNHQERNTNLLLDNNIAEKDDGCNWDFIDFR